MLGAGAPCWSVAFGCFAMGWVGGGDAKVAAASALWFGFDHLLTIWSMRRLFGGALTVLLLQFRQWPLPYLLSGQAWLTGCTTSRAESPTASRSRSAR